MDAIIFHLMKPSTRLAYIEDVIRFDFHPDCLIDLGDVWTMRSPHGAVTHHRVVRLHTLETTRSEELHAYLEPHPLFTIPLF